MHHKIFSISDVHAGAMDPQKQYDELKFIFEYLDNNDITLFTINGDLFDHKLMFNSPTAQMVVKLLEKIRDYSQRPGHSFDVILFKGTHSHDYDQLNTLTSFKSDHFHIFTETCYHEIDGLHCIFCPDENLCNDEYLSKYNKVFFTNYTKDKPKPIDIMFFHGSFDVILKGIERDETLPNVLFEYSFFNSIASIMVGGHWHDAGEYGNMYYTRSPNRFIFGEDNPKGAILIDFDTDTQNSVVTRIENPYTDEYKTYIVDTSYFKKQNDYSALTAKIMEELSGNNRLHIKIQILITDDNAINKSCIDSVKYSFANDKNVKVVVENKFTKKKKDEKKQRLNELKRKYDFLFDKNIGLVKQYKLFIKETKGIDVDEDLITSVLEKYI